MKQRLSLPVNVPAEQQDYELIKDVLIRVYIDNGCKMPLWPSVPRITGLNKTRILAEFCHNNGWREAEKLIPEFAKEELAAGKVEQKCPNEAGRIEEPKVEKPVTLQPVKSALLTDDELTCDESNLIYWLTYTEEYLPRHAKNAILLVRKREKDEFDRCMINLLETEEVQQCLSRENGESYGEDFLRSLFDVMTKALGRKPKIAELDRMSMHICTPTSSTFRKHQIIGKNQQ